MKRIGRVSAFRVPQRVLIRLFVVHHQHPFGAENLHSLVVTERGMAEKLFRSNPVITYRSGEAKKIHYSN